MAEYNTEKTIINLIASSNWILRKKKKYLNDALRCLGDEVSMMPGVEPHYNSGHTYKNSDLVSEQAMKEDKFHLRGDDRAVANEHRIMIGWFRDRIIKDGGISDANFKKMLVRLISVVITKKEQEKVDKRFKTKMPFEVKDVYNIKLEDINARLEAVGIKVIKRILIKLKKVA